MINEFRQQHCLKKNRSSQLLKRIPYEKFALRHANFGQKVYESHALQLPIHLPFGKAGSPKTSYMKVIEKCSSV